MTRAQIGRALEASRPLRRALARIWRCLCGAMFKDTAMGCYANESNLKRWLAVKP